MFDRLQNQLQKIYEIETSYQVSNFITSNPYYLNLSQSKSKRPETVLVHQEKDNLNISIYLDAKIIEVFSNNHVIDFNSMCFALEGISHFLYLIYNAQYARQVTLLEMELQAEVDKFIMLLQTIKAHPNNNEHFKLFNDVFENIKFDPSLSDLEKRRYRDANFYAEKFCFGLIKRQVNGLNWQSMNQELRRFYRLPLQDKLNHIQKLH